MKHMEKKQEIFNWYAYVPNMRYQNVDISFYFVYLYNWYMYTPKKALKVVCINDINMP